MNNNMVTYPRAYIWVIWLELAFLTTCLSACRRAETAVEPARRTRAAVSPATNPGFPGVCDLVLAPHSGEGVADRQIIQWQNRVRGGAHPTQSLENLGWAYIAKARESFDPGYYLLAEQCAVCLDTRQPGCPEASLLRGHALHNLHRFKEAEPLARELVGRRGLSFDYALLGDVLMEQGRLDEAAAAYQDMVDLKPGPQAYARIAHLRWLKGDLTGAIQVMKMAAGAASPLAREPAAWGYTRLAFLLAQSGALAESLRAVASALEFMPDYAPAMLWRGRLWLAEGKISPAVDSLKRAAQLNPLPEYQWALSEALQAAGQKDEAAAVEAEIRRQGAASDPRTYAVFLASRGESPPVALELAQAELNTRGDVFTHDALAWALLAAGQTEAAWREMRLALAENTADARIY
jgi:tetratricopeptide (TPR) repeat protein